MQRDSLAELMPQTMSQDSGIGYILVPEEEMSLSAPRFPFGSADDTYSRTQLIDYQPLQHWLEDQMRFNLIARVFIRQIDVQERVHVLHCQRRFPDIFANSESKSHSRAAPSVLDDFARGVHGYIHPTSDIINMADRMIQAALEAGPRSADIVHDDDDGMLLFEFTLANGLVIEAELEVNGILNASAYNENSRNDQVRYLLNTTEEEFVALFM